MASEEITPPREGMVTLSIAYIKSSLSKLLQDAKKLQGEGQGEAAVLAWMRKTAPGFEDQTYRRLYDIGLGKRVADDFLQEEIVSQKAVEKDTFLLELRKARTEFVLGGVVRFMGTDWFVKRVSGYRLEIRRIV